MEVNIKDYSLEKLKSMAYDLLRNREFLETNLKVVNQEIQLRETEVSDSPPEEDLEKI